MFRIKQTKSNPKDRFIPLRKHLNIDYSNYQLLSPNNENQDFDIINSSTPFLNIAKFRYHKENYQNMLRSTFLPSRQNILPLFPPRTSTEADDDNNNSSTMECLWPVKPRIKPLIESPNLILDLPNFNPDMKYHVIDCSSRGCISTIYNNEVYMWYLTNEIKHNSTKTHQRVKNCIKWNLDGTLLAVSLLLFKIGVWDIKTNKIIHEDYCCLHSCNVTCMEWISNNFLITGCTSGRITMRTSSLRILKSVPQAHKSTIINIVSSCNKNYLITSGLDNTVGIWKLPSLQGHFVIGCSHPVRGLACHPWKESILAIGAGMDEGSISLFNVNNQKQMGHLNNPYPRTNHIDCLNFNPISAELVVSNYIEREIDGMLKSTNVITVLSSMNKITEEFCFHDGRVLYLLWGDKGKLLVSASADENLCIWDFFGPPDKQKRFNKKIKKNNVGVFRSSHLCIR